MKRTVILSLMVIFSIFIISCGNDSEETTGLAVNTPAEENEALAEEVVAEETIIEENSQEITEPVEEAAEENNTAGDNTVAEETVEPAGEDAEETAAQHTIEILNDRFSSKELEIKVGETVTWVNKRTFKSMVLGVRNCFDVRSKMFGPEETFSWTFKEAETCTIVEGINTNTVPMKITVEE